LADAFTKQKIGHISLEGKGWDPKAVSIRKGCPVGEFVSNPSLTCFMLHAKSQSAGLNLVAATQYDSFYSCVYSVFLIEPIMHTGLVQQALGRIHRIGQTKPTYVWRYRIQGSVEDYLEKECQSEKASDKKPDLAKKDEGEVLHQKTFVNYFEDRITNHGKKLPQLQSTE
jgi:hypothetical protein